MSIDIDKNYCTRTGKKCRIYCIDAGRKFYVHGAILIDGSWQFCQWDGNGFADPDYAYGNNEYDLFEQPMSLMKNRMKFILSTFPAPLPKQSKIFHGKRVELTISEI